MKIYRIIDRYKDEFRLEVKATESMNQGWLKKLNESYTDNKKYNSFEEAINCPHQCYLSNDDGFLIMEVIRNIKENTYYIEYFFDDYEYIDAELSKEEMKEIDDFINQQYEL